MDSVCMVSTTACSGMDTCTASDGTRGVYALTACTVCMDVYACTAGGGIHMITWIAYHCIACMEMCIYHGYMLMGYPYTWCGYMHSILLVVIMVCMLLDIPPTPRCGVYAWHTT